MSEIQISKKYIIMKKDENGINREQIATIDNIFYSEEHPPSYEYSYGVLSFHEGNCLENKLENLATNEKKCLKKEDSLVFHSNFIKVYKFAFQCRF